MEDHVLCGCLKTAVILLLGAEHMHTITWSLIYSPDLAKMDTLSVAFQPTDISRAGAQTMVSSHRCPTYGSHDDQK